MFSAVLDFSEGRVIVSFLLRGLEVFQRVGAIMNLKSFDILLDKKLFLITLYLFCFICLFFVEEER